MRKHEYSVIGIVDESGLLVNCLSVNHLRSMTFEKFNEFLLPVSDFVYNRNMDTAQKEDTRPTLLSGEDVNTFGSIINALHKNRYYHYFITDNVFPAGIVSLHDNSEGS
jgi:hypothetical protein